MTAVPDQRRGNPVAAAALGAALVTGVSADLLLRTERIGINIWVLSLVLQVQLVLLYRRYHGAIPWTSLAACCRTAWRFFTSSMKCRVFSSM